MRDQLKWNVDLWSVLLALEQVLEHAGKLGDESLDGRGFGRERYVVALGDPSARFSIPCGLDYNKGPSGINRSI